MISRIETLSYLTTLDLATMEGDIILNISWFPRKNLRKALELLKPVFSSPFVMSDRVILAEEGEEIGEALVPKGMVGLGTICSVTINGIFLKAGIPVCVALRRRCRDNGQQTPEVPVRHQLCGLVP